jgi:hypothetical protein
MTVNPPPSIKPPVDPVQIAKWTGQVRLVLTLLAGAGIGASWLPHLTDAQISGYVGVILFVWPPAALLWSWFENKWNGKKASAVVVASAAASARASANAVSNIPLIVIPAATVDEPTATATRPVTLHEMNAAAAIVPTPTGSIA